jgi:hypothetical protein
VPDVDIDRRGSDLCHMPDTEPSQLLTCLHDQRRHVLGILDGLDDAALRRAVLPTGWTCAGMVAHLAMDVERFWFGAVVAGDPAVIAEMTDRENDVWQVPTDRPAAYALADYRRQIELADGWCAGRALADHPAWWPARQFGDWRLHTVREVLLHVIVETACHAGHLDAARELIDGRTWLVLP